MLARNIRSQVLFIALMPLLLVVAAVSVFMLSESLDDIESNLERRGNDISTQAVLMSEFYFYTGDVQRLSEIAGILINIDAVSSVRFVDANNKILAEQRKHTQHLNKDRLFIIPIYSKDVSPDEVSALAGIEDEQEERLGQIEIALSRDEHSNLREKAYLRIMLVAVSAIALGVFMVYLFGRRMSASLSEMAAAAKAVKMGDLDSRSPENGEGEILELQRLFNRMVGSLQENEADLQNRIEHATKSLNESVDALSRKNTELEQQRQEAIELERSKAISDERARIMKDMHDGIGGQLVASLAMIEKEKNSEIRDNISSALRECLDDFRLIILSLNVSDSNLQALLADFKYRINKKLSKLKVRLSWQVAMEVDQVNIQPQQSLHLLRILQEIFANILKHSDASEIVLKVSLDGQQVHLQVDDNGQFNEPEDKGGHGLKNMHWRAGELKGVFSLNKNEQGGASANLSFPVDL
ncbi:HAMP domain-containing protein [Pseudoteredinibacter isoporae]|uniref:histidine kinase n=1 Tax=Pseudoteredinibacter isoporae TaxID=570281 RepID=A0A7X0JR65_9GAMM|nr:nitrate/nitrite-specific signal transduction histidine kinase [Pseudoteredinibacter isoporae]NHO85459.1 HAMP domain-containing protein [Pseudoteredinibacter isoporae]NIB26089.1 HAMP domain-containing protein [Pseudoteredinibacter isoporae]